MGGGEEGAEAGHKGAQGSLRLGKEGRKEMGRADDLNLLGIVRFQRLKLKGRPEGSHTWGTALVCRRALPPTHATGQWARQAPKLGSPFPPHQKDVRD